MKIPDTIQIREADAYTIENEPIASVDLMERAATAVFKRILPKLSPVQQILVIAGMGNNGGDGLVLARLLLQQGFLVQIYILSIVEKGSPDFEINLTRLKQLSNSEIHLIYDESDFPPFSPDDMVIDAIFGSGLNKPVTGLVAGLINAINKSSAVVIAIDIPSGLFADKAVDTNKDVVIYADYTYTFETPKLAFLFPENEFFVGLWEVVPIGLHPEFMNSLTVKNNILNDNLVRNLIHTRRKFSHKGIFGHALLIAGSSGKYGAAILAAESCMRSGVGLLHAHLPKCAQLPLQIRIPEAMISMDISETHFSQLPDLSGYNAIGAGPGLGMQEDTCKALKLLIQNSTVPLVLDADALNILSENKTWMAFLPFESILTPHPKEFERLAGKWTDSFERLEMQRQLSIHNKVFIVLKGAHTAITTPSGDCWFNSTGNPGMATGGSGDVLTGIILGLLAQNYAPLHAALIGVYLHGRAGDLGIAEVGVEGLIASDITRMIGKAFLSLRQ